MKNTDYANKFSGSNTGQVGKDVAKRIMSDPKMRENYRMLSKEDMLRELEEGKTKRHDKRDDSDMARGQMRSISKNSERVTNHLRDKNELPAWVQSKLTMANDYVDTVEDFMDNGLDEGRTIRNKRNDSEVAEKLRKAHRAQNRKDAIEQNAYDGRQRTRVVPSKKEKEKGKKWTERDLDEITGSASSGQFVSRATFFKNPKALYQNKPKGWQVIEPDRNLGKPPKLEGQVGYKVVREQYEIDPVHDLSKELKENILFISKEHGLPVQMITDIILNKFKNQGDVNFPFIVKGKDFTEYDDYRQMDAEQESAEHTKLNNDDCGCGEKRMSGKLRPEQLFNVDAHFPNRNRVDKLHGGLADDADMDDFDPSQMEMGMDVESEHTDSPEIAREITMDHLEENPEYYTHLDKMETQMEEENPIRSSSQYFPKYMRESSEPFKTDKGNKDYFKVNTKGGITADAQNKKMQKQKLPNDGYNYFEALDEGQFDKDLFQDVNGDGGTKALNYKGSKKIKMDDGFDEEQYNDQIMRYANVDQVALGTDAEPSEMYTKMREMDTTMRPSEYVKKKTKIRKSAVDEILDMRREVENIYGTTSGLRSKKYGGKSNFPHPN